MKNLLGRRIELIGKEYAKCLGIAEYTQEAKDMLKLKNKQKILILKDDAKEPYWDNINVIISVIDNQEEGDL